ncbi:MAG: S-layer homology domain-containing protein [Chloroflexota bacterium]
MKRLYNPARNADGPGTRVYLMAAIAFLTAMVIMVVSTAVEARSLQSGQLLQPKEPAQPKQPEIGQPPQQATSDIGYKDFSWAAASVGDPTTEKPQSKLWFNDGFWWGSLFDRTTEQYYIYRLDPANQTWTNTGTVIDNRNSSRADCLWDGTHLYVATATTVSSTSGDNTLILRYSYSTATKTYTLDADFPVVIGTGILQEIVLDKDSTGQLWVTYTTGNTVYVNRTLGSDTTWGAAFVPAVAGTTLDPDDVSSLIAYDGKIGLMWSNQVDEAMYFAVHNDADPDETWQPSTPVIQGTKAADDHINLKALAGDPAGKVFAAVKTGRDQLQPHDPNASLIMLLVLGTNDAWTTYTFGRVVDDHTRPIVEIDQQNRELYVLATTSISGTLLLGNADSAIYYKKTGLDNITFPAGKGTPLIQGRQDRKINSVSSTKQNLNEATGLVAIADDISTQNYWHAALKLYPSGTCALDDFSDVPPGSTFYPFSRCLVCRGILSGYPDNTFRPGNNITRGQIAKVVSNAAGFSEDPGAQLFEDVPPGETFYPWVNRLTRRGMINGYPCGGPGEPCGPGNLPYFRTGANASRGQISKIVSESAGFTEAHATQSFEDVQPGSTFYLWVERLASRAVMSGYPCGGPGEPCGPGNLPYFRPSADVTRGQASKIVSNTFFPNCNP